MKGLNSLSRDNRRPRDGVYRAITLTVLAFNMLGDGLRDLLDPRLR